MAVFQYSWFVARRKGTDTLAVACADLLLSELLPNLLQILVALCEPPPRGLQSSRCTRTAATCKCCECSVATFDTQDCNTGTLRRRRIATSIAPVHCDRQRCATRARLQAALLRWDTPPRRAFLPFSAHLAVSRIPCCTLTVTCSTLVFRTVCVQVARCRLAF